MKIREKFEQLKKGRNEIDVETNRITGMIEAAKASARAAEAKIVTLRADYDKALGRGDAASMNSILASIAKENKQTTVSDTFYEKAAQAFSENEKRRSAWEAALAKFREEFNLLRVELEKLERDMMIFNTGGAISQSVSLRELFEKRNL